MTIHSDNYFWNHLTKTYCYLCKSWNAGNKIDNNNVYRIWVKEKNSSPPIAYIQLLYKPNGNEVTLREYINPKNPVNLLIFGIVH